MYELLVRMYGRLVIMKRKTIEEVPEAYRKDTEKWIAEQDPNYNL